MALSEQQQEALALALRGCNLFITGAAGCGKTHVTNIIFEKLCERYASVNEGGDAVVVCATTGTAVSVLARHGNLRPCTFHAFFGVGYMKGNAASLARHMPPVARARLAAVRTLFVDEISIMPPKLFERCDKLLRIVRAQPDQPFGGVQLILLGDCAQLGPILDKQQQQQRATPQPASVMPGNRAAREHDSDASTDETDVSADDNDAFCQDKRESRAFVTAMNKFNRAETTSAPSAAVGASAAGTTRVRRRKRKRRKEKIASWQTFLDSKAYRCGDFRVVYLMRNFRQDGNASFVALLNRMRLQQMHESDHDALRARVGAPLENLDVVVQRESVRTRHLRAAVEVARRCMREWVSPDGLVRYHASAYFGAVRRADEQLRRHAAELGGDSSHARPTYLAPLNRDVDARNVVRMRELAAALPELCAAVSYAAMVQTFAHDGQVCSRQQADAGLREKKLAKHTATMCVGLRVLLTHNVSPDIGLSNGAAGTVIGFADAGMLGCQSFWNDPRHKYGDGPRGASSDAGGVRVQYRCTVQERMRQRTHMMRAMQAGWYTRYPRVPLVRFPRMGNLVVPVLPLLYEVTDPNRLAVGAAAFMPLKPAEAITIHAAQGATLDGVVVTGRRAYWDPTTRRMSAGISQPGMLYVALSRARSLQCVSLLDGYDPRASFAAPRIVWFYQKLQRDIELRQLTDTAMMLDDDDVPARTTAGDTDATALVRAFCTSDNLDWMLCNLGACIEAMVHVVRASAHAGE